MVPRDLVPPYKLRAIVGPQDVPPEGGRMLRFAPRQPGLRASHRDTFGKRQREQPRIKTHPEPIRKQNS